MLTLHTDRPTDQRPNPHYSLQWELKKMRSPPSPLGTEAPTNCDNGETIPPPFDATKVKQGPTLLPESTSFDPLRNIASDDYFWNYVDNHFQPLNKEDIDSFRRLPPSTLAADDASNTYFPLSQRLAAALLDVDTPTPKPLTTPPVGVPASAVGAVTVGTVRDRQRQQDALETRLRHELVSVGLLDSPTEHNLDRATRNAQWRLRELKASNSARQRALARVATVSELRDQSFKREERRHEDSIQIVYLNRLLGRLKKNKKSRGKLQKLLTRNFGHYDHVDTAPANKSKKRKKPDSLASSAAQPTPKKLHKGAPSGDKLP